MPDDEDQKQVSNNDLRNSQFGGGFINAEKVNAQRIGGDIWNIRNIFLGNKKRNMTETGVLADFTTKLHDLAQNQETHPS